MTHEELIEKAKQVLVAKPVATKADAESVEAADPVLANELLAERSQINDELALLTARKKEIDDIIKDAIGKKSFLTVFGAKVATISRWRETSVQTDVVKEMFPLAQYPELYKRSDRSKITIH
jgi:predicted phage-related endonuclease